MPCSIDYLAPYFTGALSFIRIPSLAFTAFTIISAANSATLPRVWATTDPAAASTIIPVGTGRLESVTLRRQLNAGTWQVVRRVEYAYYSNGDLRLGVTRDPNGKAIDTYYYRYHSAVGGFTGLKYVFTPNNVDRAIAAFGSQAAFFAAADSAVEPYADEIITYDHRRRVATKKIQTAGCGCGPSGLGTFTHTYSRNTNASFDPANPRHWAKKHVETRPDGFSTTWYINASNQTLLVERTDPTSGQVWREYTGYDDQYRDVLYANPSAVYGADPALDTLVGDFTTGNATYLSDNSGLITINTYADATTATAFSPGDVLHQLKSVAIKNGENGTPVPQVAYTYLVRTGANGQEVYPVHSETVYTNDNGSGALTVTTTRTWIGNTVGVESETVTAPVVPTAQNGSNVATSTTQFFDAWARSTWLRSTVGKPRGSSRPIGCNCSQIVRRASLSPCSLASSSSSFARCR